MKKLLAVSGITAALLLTAGPAFALGDRLADRNRDRPRVAAPEGDRIRDRIRDRPSVAAPEIDVGSGTKALAVLAAGLLLVGEKLRRR